MRLTIIPLLDKVCELHKVSYGFTQKKEKIEKNNCVKDILMIDMLQNRKKLSQLNKGIRVY